MIKIVDVTGNEIPLSAFPLNEYLTLTDLLSAAKERGFLTPLCSMVGDADGSLIYEGMKVEYFDEFNSRRKTGVVKLVDGGFCVDLDNDDHCVYLWFIKAKMERLRIIS